MLLCYFTSSILLPACARAGPLQDRSRSPLPVYVQLAEQIRLLVRRGALTAGDPLPTVRELAVALSLNANTVTRVYRDLQQEGLLRLERGLGTFVRPQHASRRSSIATISASSSGRGSS